MTFAVDSNVVLDILYSDPKFAQLSIDTLTKAALQGKLISCDAAAVRFCVAFVPNFATLTKNNPRFGCSIGSEFLKPQRTQRNTKILCSDLHHGPLPRRR